MAGVLGFTLFQPPGPVTVAARSHGLTHTGLGAHPGPSRGGNRWHFLVLLCPIKTLPWCGVKSVTTYIMLLPSGVGTEEMWGHRGV